MPKGTKTSWGGGVGGGRGQVSNVGIKSGFYLEFFGWGTSVWIACIGIRRMGRFATQGQGCWKGMCPTRSVDLGT